MKARIAAIVSRPDVDEVVSGGARGLDQLAESMARAAGKRVRSIKADWAKYGRSAGHRRNPDIVAAGSEVHAFWDEASSGTAGSIGIARDTGKVLFVYDCNAELIDSDRLERALRQHAQRKRN